MGDQVPNNSHALVIPAFGKTPEIKLELANIREAEERYPEVQTVNPITYVHLEHVFNEAYRDIKRYIAKIDDQLNQASKHMEEVKAEILLDKYSMYMENKPRTMDTGDRRAAFMAKDPDYQLALDRVNQLKAVAAIFDIKLKTVENTCRYMRKQMDIILRSGLTNQNLYVTSNKGDYNGQ